MLTISSWWSSITITEQVLWIIALSATSILIIQIILMFLGGDITDMDAGGDADVAIDSDTGIDFQFLSLKNFMAFFAMFSWTAIICIKSDMPFIWTSLISLIVGLLTMLIMASIMYGLHKLSEDGSIQYNEAVKKIGTVYLTIPPKRKGQGQIQINLNGLRTLNAITDNEIEIKTGQLIEVTDVDGDILIVKPQ
ncbi:MAG: NfeD family protein [Marinilabiliaceae bacterium]|nr:NfeD family protein [Marinilabiliaceae bacterium]